MFTRSLWWKDKIFLVGDFNTSNSNYLEKLFCMQKISSKENTIKNKCIDHIFYYNRNNLPLKNINIENIKSFSDHNIISVYFEHLM